MFNTDVTRPRYNETIGTDISGNPITPNDVLNKYFDDITLCSMGEPWRYVGQAGQPDFENSWGNYSGNWAIASFKRLGDRVLLNGIVRQASETGGTIFTLPEGGYRPSRNDLISSASAGSGETRVRVLSSGAIDVTGNISSYVLLKGWFFLD